MSDNPEIFKVYDTETTGLSPHHDQVIQFAGIAVDRDLNFIPGNEIVIDIRLRPDVVPGPHAFAVHGISIQYLLEHGMTEFEAAGHIRNWFLSEPNAMLTGFNSLSFDDEQVRNMMYRTMLDPYEHEWKNSNGRMDILRLVHLVYALRPEVLKWPVNNEGRISFKLGDLCKENGIELKHAHDARFDVIATIELMRLIKSRNPRIWDYYLKLTTKDFSKRLSDQLKPLVLVDRYMPREQGHMSVVLPIIYDAKTPQKMLAVDLRDDPTELLSLSSEEIRRRMFTPITELEDGESIGSIRTITMNKQPMISELSVLNNRQDILNRSGLNVERCLAHAEIIKADREFRARLQAAFLGEYEPCKDVYQGLYSLGLIGRDEQTQRSKTRRITKVAGEEEGQEISQYDIIKLDPYELSTTQVKDGLRMFELALRAKWANFGDEVLAKGSYTASEIREWSAYLEQCWNGEPMTRYSLNLEKYRDSLAEVRATFALDERQEQALAELEAYVEANALMREGIKAIAETVAESAEVEEKISVSVGKVKYDRQARVERAASQEGPEV